MLSFANFFKPAIEQPFNVILINLEDAANGEIHCVKRPLKDDLKYVALSYRWGELHETTVDTQEDYTAIVKSFRMEDFYQLCRMMIREIDLKDMKYVWVDAICVNQTDHEQRKATIYRMSDIYKHASYILAVPDLHAAYLKAASTSHAEIMKGSAMYQSDLYDILHGTYWQDNNEKSQAGKTHIGQSLLYLEDLVKDWSTRVWVISEFNIAKMKNNMKYWFTQLVPDMEHYTMDCGDKFTFFEFEFNIQADLNDDEDSETPTNYEDIESISVKFQKTMFTQLQRQSIFEMLLKSKASRHEDRLYAILPLTDYKDKITNKATVTSWNIGTLTSLRLKLFEFMNTMDKWTLLFLSSNLSINPSGDLSYSIVDTLPTFATSSINWYNFKKHFDGRQGNGQNWNIGDYCDGCPISLCQNKRLDLFYLNFCPRECRVLKRDRQSKYVSMVSGTNRALWNLQSKDFFVANAFVIIISILDADLEKADEKPAFGGIILNGNFKKNMWVFAHFEKMEFDPDDWELHIIDEDSEGFNIY